MTIPVTGNVTIEKSTKRQLNFETSKTKTNNPIINKKSNPLFMQDENARHEESFSSFIWLMRRKQNSMNQFNNRNDQIVPNFSGSKKHT